LKLGLDGFDGLLLINFSVNVKELTFMTRGGSPPKHES
jgi:hypothetical protein